MGFMSAVAKLYVEGRVCGSVKENCQPHRPAIALEATLYPWPPRLPARPTGVTPMQDGTGASVGGVHGVSTSSASGGINDATTSSASPGRQPCPFIVKGTACAGSEPLSLPSSTRRFLEGTPPGNIRRR